MKDLEYSYEYKEEDGKYCYPDTNILRNKLDIKDADMLRAIERELTMARYFSLEKEEITGDFSLKHLCSIHHYLFQDIYEWAGKVRTVDISKGTVFCLTQFIEPQFNELYHVLKKEGFLRNIADKKIMSERLAFYLGEINMLHPFREGNGRTQRVYIEHLCKNNGRFEIHFSRCSREEMLQASIDSSICDYIAMENLIYKCLQEKIM